MLIYIAHPYTPKGDRTTADNIASARKIALEVVKTGNIPVSPLLNFAHFEDDLPDVPYEQWLESAIALMRRCDGVVVGPEWEESNGCRVERQIFRDLDMPHWYYPNLPTEVHPTEVRSPEQCKAFMEVIMKMYRVHLAKNQDYSPVGILVTGETGLATRLWDKASRLLNLSGYRVEVKTRDYFDYVLLQSWNGICKVLRHYGLSQRLQLSLREDSAEQPRFESIDDTLLDQANYSVIGLLLRKGVWGK